MTASIQQALQTAKASCIGLLDIGHMHTSGAQAVQPKQCTQSERAKLQPVIALHDLRTEFPVSAAGSIPLPPPVLPAAAVASCGASAVLPFAPLADAVLLKSDPMMLSRMPSVLASREAEPWLSMQAS